MIRSIRCAASATTKSVRTQVWKYAVGMQSQASRAVSSALGSPLIIIEAARQNVNRSPGTDHQERRKGLGACVCFDLAAQEGRTSRTTSCRKHRLRRRRLVGIWEQENRKNLGQFDVPQQSEYDGSLIDISDWRERVGAESVEHEHKR